jgi:hypothetical protein
LFLYELVFPDQMIALGFAIFQTFIWREVLPLLDLVGAGGTSHDLNLPVGKREPMRVTKLQIGARRSQKWLPRANEPCDSSFSGSIRFPESFKVLIASIPLDILNWGDLRTGAKEAHAV